MNRSASLPILAVIAAISAFAPVVHAQYPTTSIGTFTGGDAGEGLDLDGTILYAVDMGPNAASTAVRDATFTDENATVGVTVVAINTLAFGSANYGSSTDDNNLEYVMNTIRWTPLVNGGQVTVTLANLTPGLVYKLQLLFNENCCNRGFDVFAEGSLIADEFSPYALQGGTNQSIGAVITHTFVAGDTTLDILLDGNPASFSDRNPILDALSLESLGNAPVLSNVVATPSVEDPTVEISGNIADLDAGDSFLLTVDWGDGSVPETFNYPPGTTSFLESHTYSTYTLFEITVTLEDDTGAQAAPATVTANVAPFVPALDETGLVLLMLGLAFAATRLIRR